MLSVTFERPFEALLTAAFEQTFECPLGAAHSRVAMPHPEISKIEISTPEETVMTATIITDVDVIAAMTVDDLNTLAYSAIADLSYDLSTLDEFIANVVASGKFSDTVAASRWAYDLLTSDDRVKKAYKVEAVKFGKAAKVKQTDIAATMGISTGQVSSILNPPVAPAADAVKREVGMRLVESIGTADVSKWSQATRDAFIAAVNAAVDRIESTPVPAVDGDDTAEVESAA